LIYSIDLAIEIEFRWNSFFFDLFIYLFVFIWHTCFTLRWLFFFSFFIDICIWVQ